MDRKSIISALMVFSLSLSVQAQNSSALTADKKTKRTPVMAELFVSGANGT